MKAGREPERRAGRIGTREPADKDAGLLPLLAMAGPSPSCLVGARRIPVAASSIRVEAKALDERVRETHRRVLRDPRRSGATEAGTPWETAEAEVPAHRRDPSPGLETLASAPTLDAVRAQLAKMGFEECRGPGEEGSP